MSMCSRTSKSDRFLTRGRGVAFFQDHPLSRITVREVDRYRADKLRKSNKLADAQEAWRKRLEDAKDHKARREVLRERPRRPLSAGTINATLNTLSAVLEVAVEYGLIDRNPAKGKRRRLKASKPPAVWLDRAEHITALLDAAGELDREAPAERKHIERRALLSVLTSLAFASGSCFRFSGVTLT
jgi:hypothetical protein